MPNESILVVEDTPVNMKVVRVLLTRHGFDVHTAGTAEEALEVLQQFRPGLILTDVQLPGMSGLDLTRKLKSDPSTRDIIVLALTAFAMKKDEQNAYDAGCDGYITKPIDTRTLPDIVRRYIQGGRGAHNTAVESAATDDPDSLALQEIRKEFVAEGERRAERLISTLSSGFDAAEMRVTAHRWAGAAGSVGYPEITKVARELESILERNGSGSPRRVRELLQSLGGMFAAAQAGEPLRSAEPAAQPESADSTLGLLAARQETPSPAVLSALSGKRFALA